MTHECGHALCELIGGACSLATHRSRGCGANLSPRSVAPEVFDEVRTLLTAITSGDREAAVRLAEIVRSEARDDRNLVAQARDDDPDLALELARLCRRRSDPRGTFDA